MKIALANGYRRRVGGVETYLSTIIPGLLAAGHTLALWHDSDEPADRAPLAPANLLPAWSLSKPTEALVALEQWQPDLIYCHGLSDPEIEARLLKVAPGIFFAHAYAGTCISGAKAFKLPHIQPCSRQFGPMCLVNYFPRHCGGWNPITMARLYQVQMRRLAVLRQYRSILAGSGHIATEYTNHGFGNLVKTVPLPVENPGAAAGTFPPWPGEQCELLFVGRMELLKGVQLLLKALPRAQELLGKKIRLTLGGDGPAAKEWQAQAAQISQASGIEIRFVGWVNETRRRELLAAAHLLVMPSVWPEPFGLAGVEANFFGVPVVAFKVGGIPDWLQDGVNGHLAPGDPPQDEGLAQAIAKCFSTAESYARLCRGAKTATERFSLQDHLQTLDSIFKATR